MKNYWYLIAVLLLLNLSCAVDDDIVLDPCQTEFIGDFNFLSSSDSVLLPYVGLFSTTNFIYVNEAGEEITFNMDSLQVVNNTRLLTRTCPAGPTIEQEITYSGNSIGATLSSVDNSLILKMSLEARLDFMNPIPESAYDVFTISARDGNLGESISRNVFSIVVNERESDQWVFVPEFYESVEINDRTLVDVFRNNYTNPTIDAELYYSKEMGIVAFKDLDGVQWVLDRIE